MKSVMNRVIFCLSVGLSAAAVAGTPIDEKGSADPDGTVEISNISGSIMVDGWNRDEVEVTGTLGKGAERVEFRTRNGNTLIKVIVPKGAWNVAETDLVVKVPHASRLNIVGVSADVETSGIQGVQRLESVSGDVIVREFQNDLEAESVSGDLKIYGNGEDARVRLSSVSGDVEAEEIGGEVTATSVSGDIDIEAKRLNRLEVENTSGEVAFKFQMTNSARVDIETVSGKVTLTLAGERDGEYELSSFSGRIKSCFGPDPVRTSRYAPGTELNFSEGSSDARIRIETLSGSIVLCDE